MEGSSSAYPQTSTYQRFVAQIEHPGANSYIMDIFRVAGGRVHDLVFHGPGNRFEPEGIDLQASSVSLAPYQFTNVREGRSDAWNIEWRISGGRFQNVAVDGADEHVLIADGWGQRETKHPYSTLPFVLRRRSASPDGTAASSRFISLYEGYRQSPMVTDVRTLNLVPDPSEEKNAPQDASQGATQDVPQGAHETVAVMVNASDYTDYIIHAFETDWVMASTPHGSLHFAGKTGVASFHGDDLELLGVIGGSHIGVGPYRLEIIERQPQLDSKLRAACACGCHSQDIRRRFPYRWGN